MIGSLRNLFSSPKESTTKNPKSGVVKEKTDEIFMVSTIKTATIHKESQSQQKKRPQDPDLNKLMGLPKIEPILKESLEYSVLASRFTVPKHLDFGNVKSLPVEFCKLITIYIHKLVERQTRLRKQLRALKKKNQNCCNGYLQLSQNYERNKKSGIKHLEKLREELGQFKILKREGKGKEKEKGNEKGKKKEKKKKREMKKENEHENENEKENDKGSENENEKETEKEKEETIEKKELSDSLKKMISANEEEKKELGQVWKTFVEERNKIQMKNYSKAILENAIASAIDKSEKKWVKKQMKKEERRKKRELRKQKKLQGQTSKTKTKTKSQIVTKTKIKAKTTANTQTKKENKPKPKTEPQNNKTKIKNKKAKQNEKQPQKEKNSKRKKKDTNNEKNRKKERSTRKKTKQKSTKTGATEKKTENEEIITEEEKLRRENEYLKQQLEMLKNVQQIKTKDN
ncbi:protein eiger [Anaeramoeba flamelloides]|uniref:Protein eiger n=1 Tax=Anaeramoeba flamelloides TaxID=1746091 RepID=A0ABQ8Z3G2_9EUKA|nr:protein eiger [Anaeramoeba flamelloides]